MRHFILNCFLLSVLVFALPAQAESLRIAVATNFSLPLKAIAARFEAKHQQPVIVITGSTGKLYAQIMNGAPVDIFFAADANRPAKLEQENRIIAGSRRSYAIGSLVLWTLSTDFPLNSQTLQQDDFRYLAIANPHLAPYGLAAQQFLTQQGLWKTLQKRIVRGENIGQAYHFVKSGNAEYGLIALSQLLQPGAPDQGHYWLIPAESHEPIVQQVVKLNDSPLIRQFMQFFYQPESQALIQRYGYQTPDADE
ncbi:Molybdenum ABC transporter, periplasmic molybdenum-binding protein ModA [Methylophaga frappieri]|uniref:Molybdenum ABC transporter, periplasmic molybdenum-binding protein ModA n=1 Tax=Methylophaga frappieri (strain ATCC BAA-2434 / DSM 25690 / JAM7) TaxID=754477 RepID=I1YIJ6_METFJ|nr:molybdate ABC transporter substrate-binding protein [Methylophaga frappieri]AFJ02739.1 Molybdenum ABC transporter, periplasmic molybdenum-binding protein ModA [Methylophaga frappieri]